MARIRHFGDDVESGTALNEQALAEARGDDRLLAGLHEGIAWGLFLMRRDVAAAARHARAAVRAAERAGDEIARGEAYAVKAVTSQATGASPTEAIAKALALESAFAHVRVLRHPAYAQAYLLLCQDRLADARALLEQLLARAEDHGDESALPSILVQLSMAELLAGEWQAAEEHARIGVAVAEQSGQKPSRAALLGRLALLETWRGNLDEGERLAREALALGGAAPEDAATLPSSFARGGEMAAWALGAVGNARGRFADALASLSALADTLLGAGLRDPGEMRFLPDLVETYIGLGRLDEADAIASQMTTMARGARARTAAGIAGRSRAQVLAARSNLEPALRSATEATVTLAGCELALEAARAQLLKGQLERRLQLKRAARETLEAASAAFSGLGAHRLHAETVAELGRIGGRGQSDGGLTPTESRVAELVVKGMSNKEVAATLSISSKTVELHLSHVYAKLDIASRTELVRRMTIDA
jgi:DNA-binding CsgD family transcriptional regulator